MTGYSLFIIFILFKWAFYSTSVCMIFLKKTTFQFHNLKNIICDVAFYKIILMIMS